MSLTDWWNDFMAPYTIWKRHLAVLHEKTALPPTLMSIVLSGPSSVTMTHNSTAYTVIGYTGLSGTGSVFPFTPTYVSGTPGKATINSSSGIATPVATGTTSITAIATNALGQLITSNAITLTVNAQVATSPIVVSPSSFTIAGGATQQLTAVVSDQNTPANVISGASVSWGSGTPASATVNSSTGLVTGVAGGTSTITATSGSATGTSAATVTASGNAITISGGNVNPLVNGGQLQLSCVDQNSASLTPDSFTTSDATKVTVTSGGLLQGVAESGTITITAIKAGYTSGTIQVTLSGGLYSLDPNNLSQTNGQNVTSINDSGGIAWTNPSTAPTCYVNSGSGHKAIALSGTAQCLQASTHLTAFDGTAISVFTCVLPASDGGASERVLLQNTNGTTKGWVFFINTSNQAGVGVATSFPTTTVGGSVTVAGGWKRVGFTTSTSAQAVYVNGSSVATASTTYTNGAQTAGPILGAYNSTTFLFAGKQGLLLTYNRVLTTAEIAQVDLRLAAECTFLTASYTPVVTSVVVTPVSFTIAPSSTQQLTAVVYDQNGVAMPSETVTWDTSNHSFATVNGSGLVTGVANGSVTVTATSVTDPTKNGTSAGTISNSSVTSVSLFYLSVAASPMLLRTGSTYTLTAKSQSGATLDGSVGSWSSSDATNCPIDPSTGIASPNAGITGATLTYTHTATNLTGTVKASVLPAVTTILREGVTYANDAAFRANIRSTVTTGTVVTPAPTGNSSALYQDGVNEGLLSLSSTWQFMSRSTIQINFPAGSNNYGWIANNLPAGSTGLVRYIFMRVQRYTPGFTSTGSGSNPGIGASYKDLGILWSNQASGAARITNTNTAIDLSADVVSGGSGVGGPVEVQVGSITTEWSSGNALCDIVAYEGRSGNVPAIKLLRFFIGDHPINGAIVNSAWTQAPDNAGVTLPLVGGGQPFGVNYNQTRGGSQTLNKYVGEWECVNGVTYGDPYQVYNDTTTPTLSGISGGSVARGATNSVINLTGTNINDNCSPEFSNVGILVQSWTYTSTTMAVHVNVTSGAATGAGTVILNNKTSQHTSGSQTVTVT